MYEKTKKVTQVFSTPDKKKKILSEFYIVYFGTNYKKKINASDAIYLYL